MALNLEKQLLFYGAYHHDPTNVTIHMICVPILLATGILFAANTPSLIPLPSSLTIANLPPNLGTIAAFLYSSLYILMEPVAGALIAPLIIGSAALSNHLVAAYPQAANSWALALHVVSWIAQFVGHGKFEGRAPALLDNLVQALFLAPLFVWLEFLFGMGYRPELKARLDKGVERELATLNAKKAAAAAETAAAEANGKTN